MIKVTKEQIEELQSLMKTLKMPTKLFYSKAEASRVIGLSSVTLDRMKTKGVGMAYRKVRTGNGNNGRVLYPISEIARFYFDVTQTA